VVITFLSDFGLRDDFVGTCHGVIARIAPRATVIDITHGIEPQAVLQGAIVLANTIPYMPEGVHLAVVDPGVGSERRALALRDESGRLYVGPDNGLLVPAAEKSGGVASAWELTDERYMLDRISRTFHGRDVFAPAAAHLAVGVDPAGLGPAVEPGSLVRLELPEPDIGGSRIGATVLYVDRYGNVQLNLSRADVERAGIVPGRRIELDLGVDRYYATAARAFADARPGDIILYEDAYENIAVAITGGNAAEMFAIRTGQRLTIHLAD
jgi:S-adenosyl-L-methionine hydrolase (adenosine-forming)